MSPRGQDGSAEHTMLIRAPISEPARSWRPYAYKGLPKVSKRHIHQLKNMEWMLPNLRSIGEASSSVRTRLEEMLEEKVSLQADYVHVVPMAKLRNYIGQAAFLALLAPQPHKTRGLLEVDLGLAHHAIDVLLGGAGESVPLRPLTDIEEGVMTYLVIETLKALSPSLDSSVPRLRLEAILRGFEEIQELIPPSEHLAVVQLKADFGGHQGYVRLVIPEDVLSTAKPPTDEAVRRARRAADAQLHLSRLSNVKTYLRAEIGNVDISADDLSQLRARDVILVESLTCRPDQGEGGTAKLKVGNGGSGYLEADIVPLAEGHFRATVKGCCLGNPAIPDQPGQGPEDMAASPEAAEDGEEESTTPGSNRGRDDVEDAQGAIGADLMNDIPLQISVELSRVATTAEEVMALRVGHVLDLNKAPGEPLDLSVNGKVVARGELVEVDGNLGVRILSLTG